MTNPDRARFVQLSWKLLEHKCRYYVYSRPSIDDYEYDMLEKEYEALAAKLGEEPTVANMVDFDMKRPSSRLVLKRVAYGKEET
jgi:NAD-dependent DNA ligase